MTTPQPSPDPSPIDIDLIAAMTPVTLNLDLAVGAVWRSAEIWDLAHRLASHSAVLPAGVREDLQAILAATGRLEEDLHRLESAYQGLTEYIEAATALQQIQRRKAGR